MFCMFCGQELPVGAQYCKRCCIPPKDAGSVEKNAPAEETEEKPSLFGMAPLGSGDVLPQRTDSVNLYMRSPGSNSAAPSGLSASGAFSPLNAKDSADDEADASPFKPLESAKESEETLGEGSRPSPFKAFNSKNRHPAPVEETSEPGPFKPLEKAKPAAEAPKALHEAIVNSPFKPLSAPVTDSEPEEDTTEDSGPFKPMGMGGGIVGGLGGNDNRPSPFKPLS